MSGRMASIAVLMRFAAMLVRTIGKGGTAAWWRAAGITSVDSRFDDCHELKCGHADLVRLAGTHVLAVWPYDA